jgi:hypothetical protein
MPSHGWRKRYVDQLTPIYAAFEKALKKLSAQASSLDTKAPVNGGTALAENNSRFRTSRIAAMQSAKSPAQRCC